MDFLSGMGHGKAAGRAMEGRIRLTAINRLIEAGVLDRILKKTGGQGIAQGRRAHYKKDGLSRLTR